MLAQLEDMIAQLVCDGDAALCKITLTTCSASCRISYLSEARQHWRWTKSRSEAERPAKLPQNTDNKYSRSECMDTRSSKMSF